MLQHNELMSVLNSYWHLLPLDEATSADKLSQYISHVYRNKQQAAICSALQGKFYVFRRLGSGRVEVSYYENYKQKKVV